MDTNICVPPRWGISKLTRSLSSKLRRFGRRDEEMGVAATSDNCLPWYIVPCFWLKAAEDGRGHFTTGSSQAGERVAKMQSSRYEGASGLQQCGCFANVGNARIARKGNKWLGDEDADADLYGVSSLNGEESREPLRETVMPSQLMEESLSGRQQCALFVNSLKKELGGRRVEGRESLPTSFTDGQSSLTEQGQPGLPDDVVELCLARMSFSTLARARMVCRKWRDLTMSSHFLVGREKLHLRKPWLLLFGLSKDGVSSEGEIHALDTSLNRWHSVQADILSGLFLFSVASLNGLVYVLGGCSSLSNGDGKPDKSTLKTHKGVLVYNPFTYSWTKGCSMRFARTMAITGVFEIKDGGTGREANKSPSLGSCRCKGLYSKTVANSPNSRECEIGEREEWGNSRESAASSRTYQTPGLNPSCKNSGEAKGSGKHAKRDGLIVVGGQGLWNQPLFSAEIYDPFTNTWREVARLPADHGITCAGVVCNGLFYAYSETDKLSAYDFDLNIWISIQVSNTLTRLREYIPKLVSCKGKLILLGVAWGSRERSSGTGNDAEAATRMLWEFHQNSQTWQQVAKHPDAPLDWNAVSVCEGDQIYGLEMFKIFGQVLDFVTVCDLSGSEAIWKRMSRMRLGNNLDVSSCITKMAVVVQL